MSLRILFLIAATARWPPDEWAAVAVSLHRAVTGHRADTSGFRNRLRRVARAPNGLHLVVCAKKWFPPY